MNLLDFLNSDLASSNDDLRARTVACKLGFADAFMSHSWRDDATDKWHTLCTWADAFAAAHAGRSPLIWFDRACLDQSNIDASLAMLPVYLSGCKLMLILAGKTYTERLWCVMEIFTWLSLQKDAHSLMSVHPIVSPMPRGAEAPGEQGEGRDPRGVRRLWKSSMKVMSLQARQASEAYSSFANFSAQRAQCFKVEDRDRLLAIIESAFGSFTKFDERVRIALVEQQEKCAASVHLASTSTRHSTHAERAPVHVDIEG